MAAITSVYHSSSDPTKRVAEYIVTGALKEMKEVRLLRIFKVLDNVSSDFKVHGSHQLVPGLFTMEQQTGSQVYLINLQRQQCSVYAHFPGCIFGATWHALDL
ncbi:hypothetical protein [Flavihumibacter fluvii]|uniref:hypothetical protein n=1 Tax=Flavihumibacter fluvii TaxID=2838157 RepID=UPI001BDE005B|nr:hypothetical protein [Flavihumibacter fluvii]ULQ51336.1 hypothetical protein KJS93_14695 [Flavihumibacter fluvii]